MCTCKICKKTQKVVSYVDLCKPANQDTFVSRSLILTTEKDNKETPTNRGRIIAPIAKHYKILPEEVKFYREHPEIFTNEDFECLDVKMEDLGAFCTCCNSRLY